MTPPLSTEIRRLVRERAQAKCEYCYKPEEVSLYSHHVDHVLPPMHGGSSDPDNLAYACFQCNVSKGTNIASYDNDTGVLATLFHPRQENWHTHFLLISAEIRGKTPTGRVTVTILQINHPDQIKTRQSLINAKKYTLPEK